GLAGRLVDVSDDDLGALGDVTFGDGEADAMRPAGDDRDLVLKLHGPLSVRAGYIPFSLSVRSRESGNPRSNYRPRTRLGSRLRGDERPCRSRRGDTSL